MRIINFLSYIFCTLFKIVRTKYFLVYPDKTYSQVYIKNIPTIIKDKENNYFVSNVVADLINKTEIYYWINLENLKNELKN